jgi:carnitine O-acetyltransferase
VQFIVFDNAKAGIMGEHSVMDGTPTTRLCDDILDLLGNLSFDHGSPLSPSPSHPTPMDWHISPNIAKAIADADEAAVSLIDGQTLTFHLTSYGKAAIKKFGVSPDSWAQMIVQLAYARLLVSVGEKRMGATYEAATTRRFLKGRTEAIRVVTAESDKWVASMDNDKFGVVERRKLFNEATQKHLALAKTGGLGMGIDRLLFGSVLHPFPILINSLRLLLLQDSKGHSKKVKRFRLCLSIHWWCGQVAGCFLHLRFSQNISGFTDGAR